MAQETMTSEERVMAAVSLEKPDRVPIDPALTNHGAARLSGRSQAAVHLDPHQALDAFLEIYDAHDGWDMFEYPFPCMPIRWGYTAGLSAKIPGRDIPEDYVPQPHEKENLLFEDYPALIEMGWTKFVEEDLIHRVSGATREELDESARIMDQVIQRSLDEFGRRKAFTAIKADNYHPFFKLSLARSMVKFSEDLYYEPDIVEEAIDKLTDETIEGIIATAKKYGEKIIGITEERSSGYFYPLHIFERFWWPFTQRMVEAFWSEGLITHFHLDCDWTKNLPLFRNLPKGSAILSLDGMTDIFNAKKVIGDHLCLKGDIHPATLSLQEPADVADYAKRVIDEVGYNGGFILGVGCEVPSNCKPENFKALIETGKTYELGKK